ncbi:MAG: HD-GYP domain-containing protein [Lautropia sp.]
MSSSVEPNPHGDVSLAEILSALSYALDITEGQPEVHCVRCCWIGVHVGERIGLAGERLRELYYTLLLKDLGCSSNAARICELYLTDDLSFKRDYKTVDGSVAGALAFVLGHTGLKAGLAERFRAVANIVRNGKDIATELIATRCHRGASIARQLRFSDAVADGIQSLDEHWDGGGKPQGLAGNAIPIHARIALLAQVVDVFNTAGGPQAALAEVGRRAGRWFDPELVRAFEAVARDERFWRVLGSPDVARRILAFEPAHDRVAVDEAYLDDIAAAFGQVVDAKSPYTSGHSTRVARYAGLLAEALDVDPARRRWLVRAALLHDVGKLGVSNAILDKPGPLDDDEWVSMRAHALHSESILSRIAAFGDMARIAGAHHERLDGKGYPRGLRGTQIALETRIITVADFFDALTADRPYRAAMPVARALDIIGSEVGKAVDAEVFAALAAIAGREAADTHAIRPAPTPASGDTARLRETDLVA